MWPSQPLLRASTPFLKIVPAFATGIISGWAFPLGKPILIPLEVGIGVLWLASRRGTAYHQFSKNYIRGALLQMMLLLCGYHLIISKDIRNHPRWYGKYLSSDQIIEARVADDLRLRTNTYTTRLAVTAIITKTQKIQVEGALLAYLPFTIACPPAYGYTLLLATPPRPIPSSGNPGAFDFSKYAALKNLYGQVYLYPSSFLVVDSSKKKDFYGTVLQARMAIVKMLQQYIPSRKESGLAEALLIGYKENLDHTLTQVYSNTGVIHIIAISGMHLGIIYALMAYVLRLLPAQRTGRLLKLTITLTGLWIFSILAGAGPSVIRSAVMFSFLGIGQYASRRHSTVNLLWASAFLLLAYNPFWVFDIGFQLSYTALLGILLLQRPLSNLLYMKNRILQLVINLCSATLAAQALTLPLTLYYFKQIPVYFLIANLLAVPFSSIILVGEILLCALSTWHPAAMLLGTLLQKGIAVMNDMMEHMDRWPGALWSPLQVTPTQVVILYLILVTLIAGIHQASKYRCPVILLLTAIFMSVRSFDIGKHRYQHVIICYSVKKGTAVDIFEACTAFSIRDTASVTVNSYVSQTRLCRILHRIRNESLLGWDGKQNRLLLYRNLLLVLSGENTAMHLNRVDTNIPAIVFLQSSSRISLKSLAEGLDIRQVVITGAASKSRIQRWAREAASLRIPFHAVVEKGAFVMNLH